MYPATTSLVNVVPKLSSTGRDLLQVLENKFAQYLSSYSKMMEICYCSWVIPSKIIVGLLLSHLWFAEKL